MDGVIHGTMQRGSTLYKEEKAKSIPAWGLEARVRGKLGGSQALGEAAFECPRITPRRHTGAGPREPSC